MPIPKLGKASIGLDMHYSVGAIIKRDGKYLMIDRACPPYGFACVAGHIDDGEDADTAVIREVKEESGLEVITKKLLKQTEILWNTCSKGITVHYWHVYECDVRGRVKRNEQETNEIGWHTPEKIKELPLEPVWEYWLKELKII